MIHYPNEESEKIYQGAKILWKYIRNYSKRNLYIEFGKRRSRKNYQVAKVNEKEMLVDTASVFWYK